MEIVSILQEYQPYVAGLALIIIIFSLRSDDFRNWVIRLTIFTLILSVCYFGFQKIKYKFKSGNEVNLFTEQAEPEENAGMKYYRDPGARIQKATQ